MAEKDKIRILFTPSGCLSKQGLTRYIEGSLDPEEQKMADLHISSCELCTDAVTGYRRHAHPGAAIPEIHELNRQLHRRFLKIHQQNRTVRPMVSVFSVAATIILLTGIFLLLKQREMMPEKTLAGAMNDSVLTPVPHPVQHAEKPEGEFSSPSVKKPVSSKGKNQKEKASAADLSAVKTEARVVEEVVVMNEVDVSMDEEENQASGVAVPEIMTDSILILGRNANRTAQSSPSAKYRVAGKKSTQPTDEAVLTAQDAGMPATEQKEEAFLMVEEMPTFMNGDINRFLSYIQENITYPAKAAKAGIEGRVVVNFVINETGKLTDARIIRPADPLIDAEALRVVSSSPLWKPGMQRGKPVKVSFTVPIVFSLQ